MPKKTSIAGTWKVKWCRKMKIWLVHTQPVRTQSTREKNDRHCQIRLILLPLASSLRFLEGFLTLPPFVDETTMYIIFWNGAVPRRRLPSEEIDRRWENTNPRPLDWDVPFCRLTNNNGFLPRRWIRISQSAWTNYFSIHICKQVATYYKFQTGGWIDLFIWGNANAAE